MSEKIEKLQKINIVLNSTIIIVLIIRIILGIGEVMRMDAVKFKTKKCPECGAELHVNLMYCNTYDLCKVRYHYDCGWWIFMENYPLKDAVEGRQDD